MASLHNTPEIIKTNKFWHKAASPPQFALPRGHIGTTWQIQLNLCFLRLTRVHNPNGKLIGSAIFAELTAECRRAWLGTSFPIIIAPRHGVAGSHLIHASLGPPESLTQMASQLVQPFLQSSRQSVIMSGHALPRQNCCFPWGSVTPSNTWFLGSNRFSIPNGILIGSTVFAWLTTERPYTLQWARLSSKIAPSHGGSGTHLIHDSLGTSKPITQTASQLVQRFLHRWPQSLYKIATSHGACGPHLTHGSLDPPKFST